MSSDAALLQEIQRLSGAIDRHKFNEPKSPYAPGSYQNRHTYINPAIANKKYFNPSINHKTHVNRSVTHSTSSFGSSSSQQSCRTTRELVIDGIAFESSHRKLTRKDLITGRGESPGSPSRPISTITSSGITTTSRPQGRAPYVRKGGHLVESGRVHKPRFSKGKRLGGRHNMVLDNVKGTRTGNMSRRRKADKQCRFFTMTGVCQRGRTCPYQHDPEKIAICPLFLTHSCPNSADICHLSHNPNPSRVPLCHHFANHGRCTRDDCPYPHVRVGPRNGVCRDFAVVGYCDRGIECDKQHVKECPDFADKGVCPNRACKLPHVIRANRRRQPTTLTSQPQAYVEGIKSETSQKAPEEYSANFSSPSLSVFPSPDLWASGAAEGYISLTFEESDDEDDGEEENEDEEVDDHDAESTQEDEEAADGGLE